MYKHILLATDLIDTAKHTARKAHELAKQNNARLSIVYVIEPISTYGFPLVVDVGIEGVKHAKEALSRLGEELSVAQNDQYVKTGSPKNEILKLDEELKADLIIVGSQGRYGLSHLLGSTAIGVLHGSECDILIVKPPTKQ